MGRSISHWALIRKAVSDAERRHGRYLTAPEVEKIEQEATSKHPAYDLTPQERRAMKRIWPGMQLEFNLESHRV